jgi:hypothetical protein
LTERGSLAGSGGIDVIEVGGEADKASAVSDSIMDPSKGLLLSDTEKSIEGAAPSTDCLVL